MAHVHVVIPIIGFATVLARHCQVICGVGLGAVLTCSIRRRQECSSRIVGFNVRLDKTSSRRVGITIGIQALHRYSSPAIKSIGWYPRPSACYAATNMHKEQKCQAKESRPHLVRSAKCAACSAREVYQSQHVLRAELCPAGFALPVREIN